MQTNGSSTVSVRCLKNTKIKTRNALVYLMAQEEDEKTKTKSERPSVPLPCFFFFSPFLFKLKQFQSTRNGSSDMDRWLWASSPPPPPPPSTKLTTTATDGDPSASLFNNKARRRRRINQSNRKNVTGPPLSVEKDRPAARLSLFIFYFSKDARSVQFSSVLSSSTSFYVITMSLDKLNFLY